MSASASVELLCCVATRRLQNDLKMLKYEVKQLQSIDKESSQLLTELNKLIQIVDQKLRQLWFDKIPQNEREQYRQMRRDKVTDFVDFMENVKQFGIKVIGRSVEKIQYLSSTEGMPMSSTIKKVNENLRETAFNLSCNSSHPRCTQLFLSIYTEITNNLMPLLSNADLSFSYLTLVKRNIAFIQGISDLIDTFRNTPKTCSVLLFCQSLTDQNIPTGSPAHTEFSMLIDYLTGKLTLEPNYLDQNSDIQPLAVDVPPSRNEFWIKHMTRFILRRIPRPKIFPQPDNVSKNAAPITDHSRPVSSSCGNQKTPPEEIQSDQSAQKLPRKRGRKSKTVKW